MRLCHLSSAHHGLDVRIFHKECVSLASQGYDTHLVITATNEDVVEARQSGVTLHRLDEPVGRVARILWQAAKCYRLGKSVSADIYHIHDPELLPYGVLLFLAGRKVIYDVHEDVPKDILTKNWIPLFIRKPLSILMSSLEYICAKYMFSIITATPFIEKRFSKITNRVIVVNNYPLISDFDSAIPWNDKKTEVCYVGTISQPRGIQELVQAMELVQKGVRINLCGSFSDPKEEKACKIMQGWHNVHEMGFLDRSGVRAVLGRSVAGLVTLHPIPTYLDALPVKMFEYMAAGIPVIASNFPLWRDIVIGNNCGICVDPMSPVEISQAIDHLVQNPDKARRMGENGRRAVSEIYNWSVEENKLFMFYKNILVS
jgi:glycosyltransferase involved in cell wall biosynthesis